MSGNYDYSNGGPIHPGTTFTPLAPESPNRYDFSPSVTNQSHPIHHPPDYGRLNECIPNVSIHYHPTCPLSMDPTVGADPNMNYFSPMTIPNMASLLAAPHPNSLYSFSPANPPIPSSSAIPSLLPTTAPPVSTAMGDPTGISSAVPITPSYIPPSPPLNFTPITTASDSHDDLRLNKNCDKIESIFEFMFLCSKLKNIPRTGWIRHNIPEPESVAGHMYRMAMICFLIPQHLSDGRRTIRIDRDRCIKMALVHDIGEAIIGDITPYCGVSDEDKHTREKAAVQMIADCLGEGGYGMVSQEIYELWIEYNEGMTIEARMVKDIDKFEMIMQAFEYEQEHRVDLSEFYESTKSVWRTEMWQMFYDEVVKRRKKTVDYYGDQERARRNDCPPYPAKDGGRMNDGLPFPTQGGGRMNVSTPYPPQQDSMMDCALPYPPQDGGRRNSSTPNPPDDTGIRSDPPHHSSQESNGLNCPSLYRPQGGRRITIFPSYPPPDGRRRNIPTLYPPDNGGRRNGPPAYQTQKGDWMGISSPFLPQDGLGMNSFPQYPPQDAGRMSSFVPYSPQDGDRRHASTMYAPDDGNRGFGPPPYTPRETVRIGIPPPHSSQDGPRINNFPPYQPQAGERMPSFTSYQDGAGGDSSKVYTSEDRVIRNSCVTYAGGVMNNSNTSTPGATENSATPYTHPNSPSQGAHREPSSENSATFTREGSVIEVGPTGGHWHQIYEQHSPHGVLPFAPTEHPHVTNNAYPDDTSNESSEVESNAADYRLGFSGNT